MGFMERFVSKLGSHWGVHPDDRKRPAADAPVRRMPMPTRLYVPLLQHIGTAARPTVLVGQQVLKGQPVAEPQGMVSAAIHAPTSGTVVAIGEIAAPHPSGLPLAAVTIEADGEDRWADLVGASDPFALDPLEIGKRVARAGVVGMGGAAFPSAVKLTGSLRAKIATLIVNGGECEPYLSCDDRLMRDRAAEVVDGIRIALHATGARVALVGIEDNKPEAHAALRDALARVDRSDIELVQVPTRYPTGGEKQLIKVLTGKEVPSQGLPIDINIVCHNVATAAAVHRAVEHGEPLISRIVTVTGRGVATPRNLEVLIGTPVDDLLRQCGGTTPTLSRLVLGGPLMGITLPHSGLPITKTGNCILALAPGEFGQHGPVRNCIRCGECARACPANLLPQQLYWHARAKDFDKVQDYNLFDCIECGCCAYVCPANLPLVQYYRYAKTAIWAQARDKKKAELARERHDFRTERQEREKAERAAKLAKKKAALEESPAADSEEAKKAAIKAAMERAKAKREAAGVEPKNTDNLTADQQRQIDEAEARRATEKKNESANERE